jgi:hypothetical protein
MVFHTISIKKICSKIDGVVMGVYSGWDSFLLKQGGEVFLERRSISSMMNISLLCKWWHSIRSSLQLYSYVSVPVQ